MTPPPPAPPPVAIPWHRRLEAHVLVGVTLMAGIALAAVLVATSQIVTHYSLDRSSRDLLAAREAFSRLVTTRTEFAARQTRLITELPVFLSIMRDKTVKADEPTVDTMTAEYCGKMNATFCVVSDPEGAWLGRSGPLHAGAAAVEVTALIDVARRGQPASGIVTVEDELFLVVSEPAMFATEQLATFTVGYRLDDGVATELALAARCDVIFVCAGTSLCGSSLPAQDRTGVVALLAGEWKGSGETTAPALQHIGAKSYVGGIYALEPDAASQPDAPRGRVATASATRAPAARRSDARLVLLQDWSPAARALSDLHTALAWVGMIAFGVAIGGTLVFGKRITRPLRDLARVARDIASGHWARRVPVEGPAEARTMAEAFNHMSLTLSHWHQQSSNQAQLLQESAERFRSVTDSVNDAIISVNTRGEIVFWNQRAEAVFGFDERTALGRSVAQLIPARFQAEYGGEIARLATGNSPWLGSSLELCGVRHDGSEVPVELSLSTWTAEGAVFYTGVVRDITERKQSAQALREREDQLRHALKMEAVGRLAGGIAHDFNNLLTAILGYSELLLDELPADNPIRADVEGIQKAGKSAASLTKELLAFSRKQVLQPVLLDLNNIAAGTEHLLRCLTGAEIELRMKLEPNLQSVMADRGQLEQVLINLVVNARDAMPGGGRLTIGTANIVFDGSSPGQRMPAAFGPHVVLTVSDTGHGMTEDVQSHIFEPFFTTKELGKGTGLGLATVYGIVKQSGGQIWVDSAPDQGATFNVCLPAVDAAAFPDDDPIEAAESAERGSETVLLVEDNESVRALAREALLRFGYRVIEARDGSEALRIASDRLDEISVVLTDVVMPTMGGHELATRLTALRADLKVIFTSGYTQDATVRRDTQGPGAAFLQKPFTPALLGRTVREVLDTPRL